LLTLTGPTARVKSGVWGTITIPCSVSYRRILGPVYGSEKENWRILTNKEIYAMVKIVTVGYVGLGMYREWKK
jgi:hypothetical protein